MSEYRSMTKKERWCWNNPVDAAARIAELEDELKMEEECYTKLEERINDREGAEHYGPYGANCMNTGQFDAGECWLCYAKRKKKEAAELEEQVAKLEADLKYNIEALSKADAALQERD